MSSEGITVDGEKKERQVRNKKSNAAKAETIAFLEELSTRDDIWPAIRRRARHLLGLWALIKQGPGPRLKPGDSGRITAFIDRKIRDDKTPKEAIALAAEHFKVTTARIRQVYKEFSERSI